MPTERNQDGRLEAEGVLVRTIGGQVYLVEEDDEHAACDKKQAPDRSPLSGLINRH